MPKAVDLEQLSDLSPSELEAALKAQTRFSLVPYRGGPYTGGTPLKGTVKADDVNVGLSTRDWWRFLQPVFRGRIEPTASGGSRLVGRAELPPWLVWFLRLSCLLLMPASVMAGAYPLMLEAGQMGVVYAGLFAAFAAIVTVVGVGVHVSQAEQQLPALEATLAAITGSGPSLDAATLTAAQPATTATEASKKARPRGTTQSTS